jgi:hypothetical protein
MGALPSAVPFLLAFQTAEYSRSYGKTKKSSSVKRTPLARSRHFEVEPEFSEDPAFRENLNFTAS